MQKKVLYKLKSQRGAMDRILVTLILVVIALGSVVGLSSWYNSSKNSLENSANSEITNVLNEVNN